MFLLRVGCGRIGCMVQGSSDLNVIEADGQILLLTSVSGGAVVHLAKRCGPGEAGRASVDEDYVDDGCVLWAPTIVNYDQGKLLDPCWSEVTLCGRQWVSMVGGEGGRVHQWDEPAFAPTCRRCLALMDKMFPPPATDPRLPVVVTVVTDLVMEHGYAEIRGVPGDQQAELRRLVRAEVKKLSGHGCQSLVHESMVIFVCEPIHKQHALEHDRMAAEAVSRLVLAGELPLEPPAWRTAWATWAQ